MEEQPRLRALLSHYANEEIDRESLYRHLIAMARTLAQYHLEVADFHKPTQIEKSMALHCKAGDLLVKLVTLENRSGPVSPREFEKLIGGAVLTIQTYVPEELQSEALHFFRELMTPDDPNVGIPRREY